MEIPVLNEIMRDTVVEVDLDRIAFNVRQIKAMAGPGTQVAAVVKADGYGHGALGIAPAIMENGASLLAVATLSEAVELKQAYPGYPVLIMGLTPDRLLPYVLEYGIIQTIDTLAQARLLNRLASEKKQQAVIHIKYDTGFHRIGFPDCPESLDEIRQICSMPWLKPEGIYSHLALKDDQSNQVQFRCFMDAVNELESEGCHFRYKHIADSIAAVDFPEYRLDMIRAGAIVYGLKGFHKGQLDIRQALTFKTRISHITPVLKGQGVSYDYLWTAPQDTRVAALPFGYADGYPRNLRGKAMVTLRGKQVPVIGVICMDPVEPEKDTANPYRMPPRRWFLTFMCMNIPIAGWVYLLCLAFGKKENQLRSPRPSPFLPLPLPFSFPFLRPAGFLRPMPLSFCHPGKCPRGR